MQRMRIFLAVVAGWLLIACAGTSLATVAAPTPTAPGAAPSPTAPGSAPAPTLTDTPASPSVPLHLWISNQSVATDTPQVPMTVSFDGAVLFDQVMAVATGHNVAMVDQGVAPGSHTITVRVGQPYSVTSDTVVDLSGERWVSVDFWFNPGGTDATQQAPTITVGVSDSIPPIY